MNDWIFVFAFVFVFVFCFWFCFCFFFFNFYLIFIWFCLIQLLCQIQIFPSHWFVAEKTILRFCLLGTNIVPSFSHQLILILISMISHKHISPLPLVAHGQLEALLRANTYSSQDLVEALGVVRDFETAIERQLNPNFPEVIIDCGYGLKMWLLLMISFLNRNVDFDPRSHQYVAVFRGCLKRILTCSSKRRSQNGMNMSKQW